MPKTEFKLTIKPSEEILRARFTAAMRKVKNTVIPFKKISIFLDSWVQRNFKTQGGKVGGWKKLKAGGRYVSKGKTRHFDKSAMILNDFGRLKSSFLPFSSKGNAGIGSDLPYSKQHNEGKDNVPKRRILPVDKEVLGKATKIINVHIKDSMESSGVKT